MNNHDFICQDPEIVYAIFEGLYDHLKEHHGINVNQTRYVGDRSQCTTDVAAWLLLNKDNDPMMYTEYNADKNELNCRRINILEIDYKIPETKSDPVDSFQHVNWSGLFRQMDEIKDKSADAPNNISEYFRTLHESKSKPEPKCEPSDASEELKEFFKYFYESKSKPQPTLKSIINSSMDDLMSEIASMKQKAQPTMNKMERVYKAIMTELSKDD